MITETKKVLSLALAIVALGVTATELTRTEARADPALVVGGAAGYAGQRIDAAFDVVAAMPPAAPISLNIAQKGDMLPIGCAGPFRPEIIDECIDTAYEEEASEPPVILETRVGDSTSILVRMMDTTVAAF